MLNQSAEYGLRAAVHLATLPDDEHASASDISERTKVPIPYLQKVLRTLTRAGVLKARRGMGGGQRGAARHEARLAVDVVAHRLAEQFERTAAAQREAVLKAQ